MNANHYQNWIHLDFKGMVPSESRLIEWLEWIKDRGFSSVVFEYEDRIPWETFPSTFRKGFERSSWEQIRGHCTRLGLTVVPLIQTFGHLEWLLKHPRWSHLRCADHVNLLCPEHPEVRPLIKAWVNEVAAMHPESPYIHVGLDEVYHIGECEACRKRASSSSHGKLEVLLNHSAFVCDAVIRAGKKAIIWADMFLEHDAGSLLSRLPSEVVICDWKYQDGVGHDIDKLLKGGGRELMAASAIRCSFPTYYYMVGPLQPRIDNISQWHKVAANHNDGLLKAVIHTVWARSRGLAPLYGPWEGWLPAFEVAAHPEKKPLSAPIRAAMALLEQGLAAGEHRIIEGAALKLKELHSDDKLEEQAMRWWELALRHYAEVHVLLYAALGGEELRFAITHQGPDPDLVEVNDRVHRDLHSRLNGLEADIRRYLTENQWNDIEEYIEERIGPLRRTLERIPKVG